MTPVSDKHQLFKAINFNERQKQRENNNKKEVADVNLSLRLKLDKLNKVIDDLPFHKHQASRNDMAQFCEHDGICIYFTNAGSTRRRTAWHALAPCALKPWWLFLNPLRRNKPSDGQENSQSNNQKSKTTKNAAHDAVITESIEVTKDA